MTDTLICDCCDKPFPAAERTYHDLQHNPHVIFCAECIEQFERCRKGED